VAVVGGFAEGNHTYAESGIYTVGVKLTKAGREVGSSEFRYAVIYDPEGGFVTGGGWIDSPEGAYPANPSLSGKANFGFVSKYKKGANKPTGETEFRFKAAGLDFHSTSYQWLVIAGKKALYKGHGQVGNEGDYGFMLSAIDGDLNGGDGDDKFRIKIWDKAADTVVYDNQMGGDEDADPTSSIGAGSIVIHK
jgi:hypothetical protein